MKESWTAVAESMAMRTEFAGMLNKMLKEKSNGAITVMQYNGSAKIVIAKTIELNLKFDCEHFYVDYMKRKYQLNAGGIEAFADDITNPNVLKRILRRTGIMDRVIEEFKVLTDADADINWIGVYCGTNGELKIWCESKGGVFNQRVLFLLKSNRLWFAECVIEARNEKMKVLADIINMLSAMGEVKGVTLDDFVEGGDE